MQALSQTADDFREELSIPELIAELAAVVERQLEAARSLDARRLSEETELRQDLLFHLRIATQEARAASPRERLPLDCESQLNLQRITALDRRLKVVLESVSSCLSTALGRGQTDVYGLNGRMKG